MKRHAVEMSEPPFGPRHCMGCRYGYTDTGNTEPEQLQATELRALADTHTRALCVCFVSFGLCAVLFSARHINTRAQQCDRGLLKTNMGLAGLEDITQK